jgi:hypothetical protein
MRVAMSFGSSRIATAIGRALSRSAKVPEPPFHWQHIRGPWFDNCIATLEDRDDGLLLTWETGVLRDPGADPRLTTVATTLVGD